MTDSTEFAAAVLAAAVRGGTPLVYAAVGETLAQKSGVINLGIEGMMLAGALAAVATQVATGSAVLAVAAAAVAAGALAATHAALAVGLRCDQIITGLGLALLGTGVTGFLGRAYVGVPVAGIDVRPIPILADLPFVGRVLFSHDPLVYGGVVVALGAWVLLSRTRFGLRIRAVGEDPGVAYAQGVPVVRVRMAAVVLGGALAGLAGAHLSLAYTHLWAERMTAGQGWIAIGLVVVGGWHPLRVLTVAYLFGALMALHPHLQAAGVRVSPYLVGLLPYLAAILGLILMTSTRSGRERMPAALARHFTPPGG